MNKQEALEKIEELKKFIENEYKQEDWKPEKGEDFFCITYYGDITTSTWRGGDVFENMYSLGNIYKTRQLAQLEVDKRKAYVKIQRYAKRVNGDWVIDFNDNLPKFFIQSYYDSLGVISNVNIRHLNNVYFKSYILAIQAMEDLEPEYKLLFGIK